jgi:lysophospholipase L1-like esterase
MLDSNGFIVIDAYDLFVEYENIGLRATEEDPWHPNTLGHQLTAEALFETLINENIIE